MKANQVEEDKPATGKHEDSCLTRKMYTKQFDLKPIKVSEGKRAELADWRDCNTPELMSWLTTTSEGNRQSLYCFGCWHHCGTHDWGEYAYLFFDYQRTLF